jgi:hypothetical protein
MPNSSAVKNLVTFQLTGDYYKISPNKISPESIIPTFGTDLGNLVFNLENSHNQSIFTLKYNASDLAKKNGMKSKKYKKTVQFNKLGSESRQSIRQFLNKLPNLTPQPENQYTTKNYRFFPQTMNVLMGKMTNYLMDKTIKHNYFQIYLIRNNCQVQKSLKSSGSTTKVSSFSSNSYNIPNWEIGTITAGIATIFAATITYFWAPLCDELGTIALTVGQKLYKYDNEKLMKKVMNDIERTQAETEDIIAEIEADPEFGPLDPYIDDDTLTLLVEDAEWHLDTPDTGLSKSEIVDVLL